MSTYLLLMAALMLFLYYWGGGNSQSKSCTRQEYQAAVESGDVSSVTVKMNPEGSTGQLLVSMKNGDSKTLYTPDVKDEINYLEDNQVAVNVTEVAKESWFTAHLLPLLVVLVIIIVFFMMMNRQAGGGNAKMMNFGKSRAKMTAGRHARSLLQDVAGLEEEKEELQEIVDFLKTSAEIYRGGRKNPQGRAAGRPSGNR